ncbi:hypothetical protein RRF57_010598 [Xylaria bambusicola]|uniref:Uncharacterized protein n=1 Tax=Xylaria bambusicola TaxID=326684 RepID=A0AAN7UYE1_9PEZI
MAVPGMCNHGTATPRCLPFSGPCTVVAETVGIRLLSGDVPLFTFPGLGEVIAVAGFDLVTRVPGTAFFAVPLEQHIRAHLSLRRELLIQLGISGIKV